MILLDAQNLTLELAGKQLFKDLSFTITDSDRLGVLGINGTGKSTLLNVLAGLRDLDSGELIIPDSARIEFLDQSPDLRPGKVIDAVDDGWEAQSTLTQLGMAAHFDKDTRELSGGEAKRVALAKAITTPSDLLILDEPTNHLDLDAIDWLTDFLQKRRGALILVTHDRHLLDDVTTKMLELDRGSGFFHLGNYSSYLEAKSLREVEAEKAETIRRNLAKTELAWLRRGAPARTSKPKARIAAATELIETKAQEVARPADLHLDFPTPRLGNIVVELENVSVAHEDNTLFTGVDLKLDPRERLGIVGPNGAGKTSLLDVIAGRNEPSTGVRKLGNTAKIGYYDQHSTDLDLNCRVREFVAGPDREPDWTDARLLESFWFSKTTQWANLGELSGGERRRLQLLHIIAQKPNVLLLDEPTNDFDIETLRALEDFLEDWPGAVVVVSHDRAFLERVVTDALVVDGDGFVGRWPGGFGAWDSQRRNGNTRSSKPKAKRTRVKDKPSTRSPSTLRHLIKENEKLQKKLNKQKAELSEQLDKAGSDHIKLAEIGQQLAEVDAKIDQAEQVWLELEIEKDG